MPPAVRGAAILSKITDILNQCDKQKCVSDNQWSQKCLNNFVCDESEITNKSYICNRCISKIMQSLKKSEIHFMSSVVIENGPKVKQYVITIFEI